ncbi:hypothetical protein HMN09_00584600 [Mycena chlorophos]|uniref:Concanavalin A-like lectin/glucanase n=1 Tax=Mycena chlorophos TaxID=658473 RepID=A0A8H6WBM9_MYCCL|nr:hypothetical protein HMN09_00584600 [Mycena chlorophos]
MGSNQPRLLNAMRLLWPTFLSFLAPVLASIIVIDDENGASDGSRVVYSGPWLSGAIANCQTPLCASPSPGIASEETYTSSVFSKNSSSRQPTYPYNATVTFTGVSVLVKSILSNSLDHPTHLYRGETQMFFWIDDRIVGNYTHAPTGAGGFLANQTVFAVGDLDMQSHTLTVSNGQTNGQDSLVILDSIWYSVDEDLSKLATGSVGAASFSAAGAAATLSPSTTPVAASGHSSNAATIVGALVGVLAVLLLALIAFLWMRHRGRPPKSNVPLSKTVLAPFNGLWKAARRSSKPQPDMAPVPFTTSTTPAVTVSSPPPPPAERRPRPRTAPVPSSSQSRLSRISFNPNLLVSRMRRQPPAPIATAPVQSASPVIPSSGPLMRQTSLPPENIASIQAWQQQTLEATAGQPPIHPLDMSEVDLSSHYDDSSSGVPPPPPPPPPVAVPRSPQPQRRFTVMNN